MVVILGLVVVVVAGRVVGGAVTAVVAGAAGAVGGGNVLTVGGVVIFGSVVALVVGAGATVVGMAVGAGALVAGASTVVDAERAGTFTFAAVVPEHAPAASTTRHPTTHPTIRRAFGIWPSRNQPVREYYGPPLGRDLPGADGGERQWPLQMSPISPLVLSSAGTGCLDACQWR